MFSTSYFCPWFSALGTGKRERSWGSGKTVLHIYFFRKIRSLLKNLMNNFSFKGVLVLQHSLKSASSFTETHRAPDFNFYTSPSQIYTIVHTHKKSKTPWDCSTKLIPELVGKAWRKGRSVPSAPTPGAFLLLVIKTAHKKHMVTFVNKSRSWVNWSELLQQKMTTCMCQIHAWYFWRSPIPSHSRNCSDT